MWVSLLSAVSAGRQRQEELGRLGRGQSSLSWQLSTARSCPDSTRCGCWDCGQDASDLESMERQGLGGQQCISCLEGSLRNPWKEQMGRDHSPKAMGRPTSKQPSLLLQEACGWKRA